jgi:hypothetical protein
MRLISSKIRHRMYLWVVADVSVDCIASNFGENNAFNLESLTLNIKVLGSSETSGFFLWYDVASRSNKTRRFAVTYYNCLQGWGGPRRAYWKESLAKFLRKLQTSNHLCMQHDIQLGNEHCEFPPPPLAPLHLPQLVRPQNWIPNCNIVEDLTGHQRRCENTILPEETAVKSLQSVHGYTQLGWGTVNFGRNFYGPQVTTVGHAVAQLVEALRCKAEGRDFDSPWRDWNHSLT